MKHLFLSAALIAASLHSLPSHAQDAEKAEHLSFSAGYFNVMRADKPAQFGVEYKSKAILQDTWDSFMPFKTHVRPMAGATTTTDSASYVYGGAAIDIPLSEHWNLATHAVVGWYNKGAGLDLGGPMEFREGIGAEYMFDGGARAGFSFNHHSNAFMYDENPGAESFLFNYSQPVNFLQ